MKETRSRRWISLLLTAVMLLSLIPAAVMPAAAAGTAKEADDDYNRILHLDCGRKYFTADWIKALINEMAAAGYNQLQLAFGNDGLRFLLDDMSFAANGTTYSHDTVVSRVEAGNQEQNSSGDARWLTQTEMDGIIAHAKSKNIEIVPLLNLPGHANALLDIAGSDDVYNASGSDNTLDVANNDEAVAFGYAIFQKYVDYFAGKGCKYFNFGADEYANDASGTFSFSRLDETQYAKFVEFINKMASYIKGKNMTPRAFNDGLYYNNQSASIDTSIQCCYWSSGWSGYDVASARTIAGKGHEMINTNGDYYYVLGKDDKFDSDYSYASNFSNTAFMGSTISSPVGSMFCIWCDFPNAETEQQVAQKTRLVLRAMAARMQDQNINTINDAVVAGGFNEDGSINIPGAADETGTVSVDLTVGGTKKFENVTADAGSYIDGDNAYIATAEVTTTTTPGGTVYVPVTTLSAGTYYVSATANDPNPTVQLTLEDAGSGTYYLKNGNQYIYPDASYWRGWSYSLGTAYSYGRKAVTVSGTNGAYKFSRNVSSWGNTTTTYLTLNGTGFGASDTETTLYLYEQTTQAGTSTSALTITGVGESSTTAKVGGTTYNINVTAPKTEETKTLNFGGMLNLPAGATDVKVEGTAVKVENGVVKAGNTAGNATVTCELQNAGGYVTRHYTYSITVTEVDLSDVTPLTIEYWITNAQVTANGATEMSVAAAAAYSENGVDVSTLVPQNATKETNPLDYWKTVKLEYSGSDTNTNNGHQTRESGDNETTNPNTVTRVRYWNNHWQVLVGDQWETVDQESVTYYNGGEWVTKAKTQIVAYYLEYIDISDELDVNAADWGKMGDGSDNSSYLSTSNYNSISIQVIYEDGTMNPQSTSASDLRTTTLLYDFWSTSGRGIGTLMLTAKDGYQIYKVAAETGEVTVSTRNGNYAAATVNSFTWDNNPKTVFEDAGNPVDSYTLSNNAHSPSKDGYYDNLQWDENKEAILITVYVKAKATDDSLTVIYQDEKFNAELYRYSITVPADVDFKETIINSRGTATTWDNITDMAGQTGRKNVQGYGIKNTLDVAQWFQTDLTKVPQAHGKYRSDLYTYTGSEISTDGKTLYLYYTINTEALSPNFVADFGLPIRFPLTDLLGEGTEEKDVTTVGVNGKTSYGTLSYDTSKKNFTYTPTKVIPSYDVLTITLTFSDGKTATTNVGVTAASNVLYEDSFLTENTTHSYADWTKVTAANTTQQQEAQKAGDTNTTYNVFGYDTAYVSSTHNSMGSAWTISDLNSDNASKYLTTSFYGNGFDLIGTAGPDTGYVYLLLKKNESNSGRLVVIDTSYVDGKETTLYQVPLAHVELDEAAYTVNIRAAHRAVTTASAARAASTYCMNSADPMEEIYAVMEELYQDGFEIDDIEVVGFDEAAAVSTLSEEASAAAAARPEGTTVTIDGFRVYRSSNNESYPEAEQNVTYVNVLNATLNGDNFTAYTESRTGTWTQNDYESSGGPQNEVYLANGNAIAFKVDANAKVQISARAVSGAAKMTVNGATVSLNSNTEMYYEVTPKDGIVTISNTGDAMVALGNLKLSAGIVTAALTAEDEPAVFALLRMTSAPAEPEGPETSVFTPEKLDINVKSLNVIRNKLVTLTITTSTDVASLTVNGKTLKPTNSWLVKRGWSDEYIYVLADKVKRGDSKTYEVIAYNADGTASAVRTVNG